METEVFKASWTGLEQLFLVGGVTAMARVCNEMVFGGHSQPRPFGASITWAVRKRRKKCTATEPWAQLSAG